MDEKGFTVIETIMAMLLSATAIMILLIIPKRISDSYEAYSYEAEQKISHSTITLYLNKDLSKGYAPVIKEDGFRINDATYTFDVGLIKRDDSNNTITLSNLELDFKVDNQYITIYEPIKGDYSNEALINIKIPLKSAYYLKEGKVYE